MGDTDIEKLLKDYLRCKDKRYFVDDVKNVLDEKDVEWLFILESPHKDEFIKKIPLQGLSGISVSKFFGFEEKPFGELINTDEIKNKANVAILNVSQVPLQRVDKTMDNEYCKIYDELDKIRDCGIDEELKKSFNKRLKKYEKNDILTIVVCGLFAKRYFDAYINGRKGINLLRRQYNDEIRILFVPHPSRHQWSFIEKHKENLATLKELFNQSIEEK